MFIKVQDLPSYGTPEWHTKIQSILESRDSVYDRLDIFGQVLTQDVWKDKYRNGEEKAPLDTFTRVAKGIYEKDSDQHRFLGALAMHLGLWMPGGRILAGAGTGKRVTLMNCYVNETLDDSMVGIMKGLNNIAFTQQMGGGIGTDFSPIRPPNALVSRTQSPASGPEPFIDSFYAVGTTVASAGARRQAQMGTISDTHPFMPGFVTAKQQAGKWLGFNVSVLVSDAFMAAVQEDAEWLLYFPVPPVYERSADLVSKDFDLDGVTQYVYEAKPAREYWEMITRNTYEYSEPGVIFIDRVNDQNNLQYCETIRCTNPCVTGDTLILTDKGYSPIAHLVGRKVKVWNGQQFSEVTPFSTGINNLLEVTFSNGAKVKATHYHKWALQRGVDKETAQLQPGDKLCYFEMPTVIEGEQYSVDAYSQGFYSGDGTKNSDQSNLYKHGEGIRDRLVGKFWDRNCVSQPGHRWQHGEMLPKSFVPINGTAEYCVNWLAGLMDADGCTVPKHQNIQLTAKDRKFLDDIRIMLSRLGIISKFWERKDGGPKKGSNGKEYMCEPTACLMLNKTSVIKLVKLGFKTERLDLSTFQELQKPSGPKVPLSVRSIRAIQEPEETFCFTEPLLHMGVFNGVPGRQCGEQPLPPNGTCNLGAVNLAFMVKRPFTEDAEFNWDLLAATVQIGVRFLDNVIDVTAYPLPEQEAEEISKRRVGLGFSGLADAMAQLGIRYGSSKAARFAEEVTKVICLKAYETSVELSKERGAFPLFDKDKFFQGFAGHCLPPYLKEEIAENGIRNGVLLTIAPTGTTSILYGNISSGIEPTFLHTMKRKVVQADGSKKEYIAYGFGALMWNELFPNEPLPHYMVTAEDLTVYEHIRIQEVCQRWIDASISKTINLPKETSYEDFQNVYFLAYEAELKGCTTYRPSDVRGSVLSAVDESAPIQEGVKTQKPFERPRILPAQTMKLNWPGLNSAIYLTMGQTEEGPFEVFLSSKDQRYMEWMTATTLMISWLMRAGVPVSKIAQEMKAIQSTEGGWADKKYHKSIVAYLGGALEELASVIPDVPVVAAPAVTLGDTYSLVDTKLDSVVKPTFTCPQCGGHNPIMKEGCISCGDCSYSKCS